MAGQNGLLPANPETDLELLGPDRVRVKRLLGTGAFASVYLAELTADGQTQQVALKVAKSPTSLAESSNQERLFTKEALVMQLMNSEFIVRSYGFCRVLPRCIPAAPPADKRPPLALALEFLEGGSLARLVLKQMSSPGSTVYSDWQALGILQDVAQALCYLHSQTPAIIHRDLKQENVLLTKGQGRLRAKLADMGLHAVLDKRTHDAVLRRKLSASKRHTASRGNSDSQQPLATAPSLFYPLPGSAGQQQQGAGEPAHSAPLSQPPPVYSGPLHALATSPAHTVSNARAAAAAAALLQIGAGQPINMLSARSSAVHTVAEGEEEGVPGLKQKHSSAPGGPGGGVGTGSSGPQVDTSTSGATGTASTADSPGQQQQQVPPLQFCTQSQPQQQQGREQPQLHSQNDARQHKQEANHHHHNPEGQPLGGLPGLQQSSQPQHQAASHSHSQPGSKSKPKDIQVLSRKALILLRLGQPSPQLAVHGGHHDHATPHEALPHSRLRCSIDSASPRKQPEQHKTSSQFGMSAGSVPLDSAREVAVAAPESKVSNTGLPPVPRPGGVRSRRGSTNDSHLANPPATLPPSGYPHPEQPISGTAGMPQQSGGGTAGGPAVPAAVQPGIPPSRTGGTASAALGLGLLKLIHTSSSSPALAHMYDPNAEKLAPIMSGVALSMGPDFQAQIQQYQQDDNTPTTGPGTSSSSAWTPTLPMPPQPQLKQTHVDPQQQGASSAAGSQHLNGHHQQRHAANPPHHQHSRSDVPHATKACQQPLEGAEGLTAPQQLDNQLRGSVQEPAGSSPPPPPFLASPSPFMHPGPPPTGRASEESTPLIILGATTTVAGSVEEHRSAGGAAGGGGAVSGDALSAGKATSNSSAQQQSSPQQQGGPEGPTAAVPIPIPQGRRLVTSLSSLKQRVSQGISRLNRPHLPGAILTPGASYAQLDMSQSPGNRNNMSTADVAAIKVLLGSSAEVNFNQPAKLTSPKSSLLNHNSSSQPDHSLPFLNNRDSASVVTVSANVTPGNTQHGTPPSGGYLAAAAALASGGNSGNSHATSGMPGTSSGHRTAGRGMYRTGTTSMGQQYIGWSPLGPGGTSDHYTSSAAHRDFDSGLGTSFKGSYPPKHGWPTLSTLRTVASARQAEESDRGKSSGSIGEILAIHLPGTSHQQRQISMASLSILGPLSGAGGRRSTDSRQPSTASQYQGTLRRTFTKGSRSQNTSLVERSKPSMSAAEAAVRTALSPEFQVVYNLTTETGSYMYMAPEVHRHEPYNQSADVYSFGVLMYEVMARTMLVFTAVGDGPAHVAKTAEDYAARAAKGMRPEKPTRMDSEVWELISQCWAQDPIARPSMTVVAARLEALMSTRTPDSEKAGCRCF